MTRFGVGIGLAGMIALAISLAAVSAGSAQELKSGERAIIITRFDSGIGKLADLKGRRFAFVDSASASGFVYPRALLADKGIDPSRDLKETLFAGSPEKVIAAVLLGRAQAGATTAAALGAAAGIGMPTFDIVVLAVSDPIPADGHREGVVRWTETNVEAPDFLRSLAK